MYWLHRCINYPKHANYTMQALCERNSLWGLRIVATLAFRKCGRNFCYRRRGKTLPKEPAVSLPNCNLRHTNASFPHFLRRRAKKSGEPDALDNFQDQYQVLLGIYSDGISRRQRTEELVMDVDDPLGATVEAIDSSNRT